MRRQITATEFKVHCLHIIDEMNKDRQPVTITKRGRPVALLSPMQIQGERESIIGAMRGSVLRYDDPFQPAADASDWNAMQ